MPSCKHYGICGLTDEADPSAGMCILHSKASGKDKQAFAEALRTHRTQGGNNFSNIVFPEEIDFSNTEFDEDANFSGAMFNGTAHFTGASFQKNASFWGATFDKEALFSQTRFGQDAIFNHVKFLGGADFSSLFSGSVSFNGCSFRGRTYFGPYFVPLYTSIPIFSGLQGQAAEVDFRNVVFDPPDSAFFLVPDFRKCQFLGTHLRKVQIMSPTWPEIPGRFVEYLVRGVSPAWPKIRSVLGKYLRGRGGIYDEVVLPSYYRGIPWDRTELLYRELKHHYEDQGDYERAGDYHYGEKEMRRCNPKTPFGLRVWLTLYWLFSGYGEQYLPPLMWAAVLFVLSTVGYMAFGLRFRPEQGGTFLALTNLWDWLLAAMWVFT
ncbi:MAG: pentapeptide repeat-containing protein [candidate division NC10 bacterium]|nr:pentapeptide repeat-containing protein [candidate division NC10 bacterium]